MAVKMGKSVQGSVVNVAIFPENSEVVHLSGDEVISGVKTFSSVIQGTAQYAEHCIITKANIATPIAADTDVTVPSYIVGANNLHVYIDGILCDSTTYTEQGSTGASSTTIQFSSAISNNFSVMVEVL